MTNDRQEIIVGGGGGESRCVQRDSAVHLTELLPVEHSRIITDPDDDCVDQETTDGLRALRSFARGEDPRFSTENDAIFDSYRKIDRVAETDGTEQSRRGGGGGGKRRRKPGDDGGVARNRESEMRPWNASSAESSECEEEHPSESIEVEDQIYYYRQRPTDARESSDEDEISPEKPRGVIEEGNTLGDVGRASRRRGRKVDRGRRDGAETDAEKRERARRDLRLEMNGIIEASNCLLEGGDNNNVEERNHNETKVGSKGPEAEDVPEGHTSSRKPGGSAGKKYRCVICDSSFKGSGGLRNHYKVVHAAGPIYKCDECGKEFPLKERLKLHVRTHTGFKPYKCPECHKSFARGGQLVQHRGTHSKVKPYRCNLCSGTFTCAANLALHLKRHNGQKDHKCEICGRGFVRKDALKKHLECLHRDVKSFLCSICNKTFKGHLPQHMRTHAQDRPHGCATCGQRFAQKSQLTVHQRTHSGQRPFRCLVCWQAFAHSTALKLHTRRHTGERPFKCAECNAGFTQLPHWKKHMKCIHGRSEPYSCKNCDSFFRIKNDLENHEKTCYCVEAAGDDDDSDTPLAVYQRRPENPTLSSDNPKFRSMSVERMRLLLAVLLKRISRPERLEQLGFGKRLIDEVLQDSLLSAGKEPSRVGQLNELESLRRNLETFLEWTVPKEHWDKFRKINKTPEEILETLTAT